MKHGKTHAKMPKSASKDTPMMARHGETMGEASPIKGGLDAPKGGRSCGKNVHPK